MATVRPYLGRNSQYGFAFHFGVMNIPGGGAIVYNGRDGCIWARLPADKNINNYDHSINKAHNLCHVFNGYPGVDIEGIDGTP